MNEKPYAKRAVEFADALVKQQFEAAYGMLGERLREEVSPAQLRSSYEAMVGDAERTPTVVELVTTMEQ
ncbi:hypothetical protein [Arhodomonas sp. AD133]|uniref:hypothetical protein n=1 Tax=Arhodomonas sp. AD133 TaxID=3415009 RepID=UPI003EBDECEB